MPVHSDRETARKKRERIRSAELIISAASAQRRVTNRQTRQLRAVFFRSDMAGPFWILYDTGEITVHMSRENAELRDIVSYGLAAGCVQSTDIQTCSKLPPEYYVRKCFFFLVSKRL